MWLNWTGVILIPFKQFTLVLPCTLWEICHICRKFWFKETAFHLQKTDTQLLYCPCVLYCTVSHCVFPKFSMRLVSIQSACCSQLLLLAAQMSSNWVAVSPARLHLGCEGYVSQTVTRPRNPLCLSPADIHIHVTMPLWPETGFG